jgi:hypothetical protein
MSSEAPHQGSLAESTIFPAFVVFQDACAAGLQGLAADIPAAKGPETTTPRYPWRPMESFRAGQIPKRSVN